MEVSVDCVSGIGAGAHRLLEGGEEGTEAKAKHSLAYIQLEKQNERLKEGLLRCNISEILIIVRTLTY